MAYKLEKLERAHQSGEIGEEEYAKERLLIITRYPEVGGQLAQASVGENQQSAAKNLKARRSRQRRITVLRYAAFILLFGLFAGGFYLLGLTNSRYAESIHWERTFVAIIGAFAIAFVAGTIHLILNEWHAAKGWGHFVFLAAIVLFTALNQGIVYNPWDPALQQVDTQFDKPTFLSHVGVLVVTISTLILTGFAVAAGFLSAGFSTLPKIVVGLLSPRR